MFVDFMIKTLKPGKGLYYLNILSYRKNKNIDIYNISIIINKQKNNRNIMLFVCSSGETYENYEQKEIVRKGRL